MILMATLEGVSQVHLPTGKLVGNIAGVRIRLFQVESIEGV
jgi:hypothetical protein